MSARIVALVVSLAALGVTACRKGGQASAGDGSAPGPAAPATPPGDATAEPAGSSAEAGSPAGAPSTEAGAPSVSGGAVLLLTQARFANEPQPDGTTRPKPGPATLVVLRKTAAGWEPTTIQDPDSNVFHKAMVFDPDGHGPGILTIAAMGACLKVWRPRDGVWNAVTLWHPEFGGRFDRLRDVEIGDVTGDGRPEIVVATHDQGVVGVLTKPGGTWVPAELDRRPGMFVHEAEIGDIDGDGNNEFFTTPSQPNVSGRAQGGGIDVYRWNGSGFDRSVVMQSEGAHAKEILVADLDRDGRSTLFAALETRTEASADCRRLPDFAPMRIVRYEPEGSGFAERPVATLPDCMCRFLAWGDVDGDGTNEIVAAPKNAGLFLVRLTERGPGTAESIDQDSSGFEHATLVADLDGDGSAEIYVAADKQGELRRYVWNRSTRAFDREAIFDLGADQITWNVTAGVLP